MLIGNNTENIGPPTTSLIVSLAQYMCFNTLDA